jgi:hypothetical protein
MMNAVPFFIPGEFPFIDRDFLFSRAGGSIKRVSLQTLIYSPVFLLPQPFPDLLRGKI